uniref:DUF2817 domain-containing protein n=1 Tax=Leptospira ellisii TaxID=2023197 RepID=A0A2N0B6V9_9LEPT|nr:hypothetical protein CH379_14060 [Leptospira ellisii]
MYDSVRFYFVRSLCIAATLLIVSCGDPERDRNPNLQADPKRLAYFEEDYESSRRSFRNSADEVRKKYKGVLTNSIPVSDKNGQGLTIDSVYVPAQTKKNGLVVITSGIHGSEAAAGAAAQRWILSELLSRISLEETGILLIHSLNPYGFKNFRRTSENNVDLNRNCHPNPSSLAGNNPTYAQVNDFLNPEEPASFRTNERSGFRWKTLLRILRFGRQAFRSAVAQGQYEFPKGIFFGGNSL